MGKEEGLWAEELSKNERCACDWIFLCVLSEKKPHEGSGRLGGGERETPIFISSQTVLVELTCSFLENRGKASPYFLIHFFFLPPGFSETPRMLLPRSPPSAHSPALADHSNTEAVTSDECVEGLWLGS